MEGIEEDGLLGCLIDSHNSYLSLGILYPLLYFVSKLRCSSSVNVGSAVGVLNTLEGTIWRSSICPGFNGYIPHLRKPLRILTGVSESGQAFPRREASTSTVTTLPGFSAVYVLHALLNAVLNDLNTPISNGCRMCVV